MASRSSQRCCKCLKTGVCVGCSCVKSNSGCVSCYPSRVGRCRNPHSRLVSSGSALTSSSSSATCSSDSTLSSDTSRLPTLEAIFHQPSSSTLRHVPKGARDNWASLLQVWLLVIILILITGSSCLCCQAVSFVLLAVEFQEGGQI